MILMLCSCHKSVESQCHNREKEKSQSGSLSSPVNIRPTIRHILLCTKSEDGFLPAPLEIEENTNVKN